ncbi:MAG TPA: condensation domain-containing protein, partial [Blastocatellia bacterium]|nr:condensation domain-containing protein [Blastocatellia bacterium]
MMLRDKESKASKGGAFSYGQIGELSAQERDLLELLLKEEGIDLSQMVISRETQGKDSVPLSFAQERLWILQQIEPDNPVYNKGSAIRLTGAFDLMALIRTLSAVIERQEILRTVFPSADGRPFQRVQPVGSLSLRIVDLSSLAEAVRGSELLRLGIDETRKPFALESGPLLRLTLLRMTESEHVLVFCTHHILVDGWAGSILTHEFAVFYRAFSKGLFSSLPDLTVQYGDFAVWERKTLDGATLEDLLAYWSERLAGSVPVLSLPTDRPRPAVQTSNGAKLPLEVNERLTAALNGAARRENVTVFMVLLAAFKALLFRYTGESDIIIGTSVTNRDRPEFEGLMGLFANTLVLRTNVDRNSRVSELLSRVRDVTLGALAHKRLPFEKLVERLNPSRSLSTSPVFQVWFDLLKSPPGDIELPDLSFTAFGIETNASQYELMLELAHAAAGLKGCLDWNTDLFDRQTIERMADHYLMLLEDLCANPGKRIFELEMFSAAERERILAESEG